MPFKKLFIYGLMVFICGAFSATAAEYRQVSGLIDTRSSFSDGYLDFEAMTLLARKRGFDALFFNDHDRLAVEYGIFPLRNILKKKVELNSIKPGIPVLLCTGYSQLLSEEDTQAAGIQECLKKPFDEDVLLAAIARSLAGKQ